MTKEEKDKQAEEYFNQGIAYAEKGDYDKAIENYNKAIELNPDYAEAYLMRGNIYDDKGDYDMEIANYNKAIELDQDFALAYYNRGSVYGKRGEYDKAIEDFNKAIELDPDYVAAYNNRGIVYRMQGYYDKAIENYNKAIELDPNNATAYNNRGNAYDDKGDYDKAIENYNKAIELNPNDAPPDFVDVCYQRGFAYAKKGCYDKAIENFDKVIELDPNHSTAYNNRGVVYEKKGDHDKAIENFDKVIALDPDYAGAYNNRGLSYYNKNDYAKAIENLNKAIELKPDYADPYFIRGQLYRYLFNNNIILEKIQSDITQTYNDWNTYIYLSRNTGELIDHIHPLTEFYQFYPQTIQTILEYANVNLDSVLFNRFEDAQQAIADFTALLQLYENVIPDRTKFLSIKAILHYYLGGAVSSYIIFDEQLDDGEYTLSSQEYYYYALTAKEINREAEAILYKAICDIENKTDKTAEDFYYLAHLYLLRNDEAKAIEYFKQSDSFIFSVIMLAYLSEDDNYIDRVEQINQEEEIYNFSTEIDYARKDLSQFQNFFHLQECEAAIQNKYDEQFWEVFKLSDNDKREIEEKLREITSKNILESLQNDLINVLDKKPSGEKISIAELEDWLVNIDHDMQTEYDFVRKGEETNRTYANQIGLCIYGWKINNPKFYTDLIRLFYLNKSITSKEAFTLYFYLLYIIKKKHKIHLQTIEMFYDVAKSTVPDFGISLFLIGSKMALTIMNEIYAGYEKYRADHPDIYRNFSGAFDDSFWKYIANDKATLSELDFERKYRCFKWFNKD